MPNTNFNNLAALPLEALVACAAGRASPAMATPLLRIGANCPAALPLGRFLADHAPHSAQPNPQRNGLE